MPCIQTAKSKLKKSIWYSALYLFYSALRFMSRISLQIHNTPFMFFLMRPPVGKTNATQRSIDMYSALYVFNTVLWFVPQSIIRILVHKTLFVLRLSLYLHVIQSRVNYSFFGSENQSYKKIGLKKTKI